MKIWTIYRNPGTPHIPAEWHVNECETASIRLHTRDGDAPHIFVHAYEHGCWGRTKSETILKFHLERPGEKLYALACPDRTIYGSEPEFAENLKEISI